MDLGLNGKIALVTGSSSGLGKSIAKSLALENVAVIINGRDEEKVNNTVDEIRYRSNHNVPIYPFVCRANDPLMHSLLNNLLSNFGRLDILVNNIGGLEKFGLVDDLDSDDWLKSYELNCLSMVNFCNVARPFLRKSKSARIVNIGSLSGIRIGRANPHYGSAKAAMLHASAHIAKEFAKDNILVNSVSPSTLTDGEWFDNIFDRSERDKISREEAERIMTEEEKNKSPLHKIGSSQDVSNLILFLVSERNQFISGVNIPIDGAITSRTS